MKWIMPLGTRRDRHNQNNETSTEAHNADKVASEHTASERRKSSVLELLFSMSKLQQT